MNYRRVSFRSSILFTFTGLITGLITGGIVGCENAPAPMPMDEPPSANLVSQSDQGAYDWPVTAGLWQVSPPTGIKAMREIGKGTLGKRYAKIVAHRQQLLAAAKTTDKPQPWQVDAYDVPVENRMRLKVALGEIENKFDEQCVITIPSSVQKHHLPNQDTDEPGCQIKIDHKGRRMAVLNDALWLCRLPWRESYLSPDFEKQASDEPGTPDVFDQVPLSNATSGVPVFAEFYGEDGMMIAAKGKNLYAIDSQKRTVVAQTDVGNPIVYLDVACETGDAIIVDSVGKIHLLNHLMKQVVFVGECDLEFPMPVISPEAARIAVYQSRSVGRVFKIEDLVILEQFDVALNAAGDPVAMRSGRRYDIWIQKNAIHKRPNYPNRAGTDRDVTRLTMYWDIHDVIDRQEYDTYEGVPHHSQFTIAQRPIYDDDGTTKKEWVAFDGVLGNSSFFAPIKLPDFEGKNITAAGRGSPVCISSDSEAKLYFRFVNYNENITGIYQYAYEQAYYGNLDHLEDVGKLIFQLPEDRFGIRPEEFYQYLISGISEAWKRADTTVNKTDASKEDRQRAKDLLTKLNDWAKKKSTLAITCKLDFHANKAWTARGGSYASGVSQKSWEIFAEQNKLAMELWDQIADRDDVSTLAYAQYIHLARDTNLNYDDTTDVMIRAMQAYPAGVFFHIYMTEWLQEKWGGRRASSAAYCAALSDAIGAPRGDFVYTQCLQPMSVHYDGNYLRYSSVEVGRLLRGIRFGMDTHFWQTKSTQQMIVMLAKSITVSTSTRDQTYVRQARNLCEELSAYYRSRFPMKTSLSLHNNEMVLPYLPK